MAGDYRCATYEEAEALGYDETSSVLLRPDGTVLAVLGEPEDRSWYRDGYEAITELNALRATIARLEAERADLARDFARLDRDHDELGASAARMRLALETLEGRWLCDCTLDGVTCENKPTCPDMIVALALEPEGHPLVPLPGGLVDSVGAFWPTCATCGKTHRDPAPLEWLQRHDAEVVEPYREALTKVTQSEHLVCAEFGKCAECAVTIAMRAIAGAGRAGTEAHRG